MWVGGCIYMAGIITMVTMLVTIKGVITVSTYLHSLVNVGTNKCSGMMKWI